MRLPMKLLVKPSSFTSLAALTTLAVSVESFAFSNLSLKSKLSSSAYTFTRGRVATSTSSTGSYNTRAFNKECLPTSFSPKYNNLVSGGRNLKVSMSTDSSSSKGDGLYLFDFDGDSTDATNHEDWIVVCDSCDECTVSAWRTCKILNAIKDDDVNASGSADTPPKWLFDKMREIRPAIEVGWQIPVLLSVFLEQREMAVPDIIQNYETLVNNWLREHDLKDEDMIRTFGQVRDDWIANDLESWLEINAFYDGISRGISECSGEAVLVTTKQHRFATALVRHAGVEEEAMSNESIYGLGMYKSKSDVIVDRMKEGGSEAVDTHFFEDRWPTIAKCLKDDRLEKVNFYLCSWGYCTEEELKLAENEPRVTVLKLDEFVGVVTK